MGEVEKRGVKERGWMNDREEREDGENATRNRSTNLAILLTEIESMNVIICGRHRWTKGLSAVIKFSFTLKSTKLAMFCVLFVTSFSVLSAVGLGGSAKKKNYSPM